MKAITSGLGLLAALVLAACGDATGPGGAPGRLSLHLTTGGAASGSGPALAPETLTLGGNTLVVTRVQMVLREIELKRARGTDACPSNGSSGSSDDCEELTLGPILLDLPLGGSVARVFTVEADTGTFRELEFDIHKPEDDGRDREFLARHPDFRRVSIRVDGTYNGAPFVFITDLNTEQEVDLVPPLVIGEGRVTDLTLRVNLRDWFLNASRTTFVSPASANKGGPNEGLVKDNIEDSFEAFEDDDRDGRRD